LDCQSNKLNLKRTDLPNNCPPNNNQEIIGDLFRLVKNDPPGDDDFLDWIDEFPGRKFSIECKAKSMCLFINGSKHHDDLKKTPRMLVLYKYQAQIKYDKSSGNFFLNNSGHVSWWRSQTVDPKKMVIKLEDFDDK
jgi:hypothetical protein